MHTAGRNPPLLSDELKTHKTRLENEIKTLHPSWNVTLKKLSKDGVNRVEAVLGYFCKAVAECIEASARQEDKKSIRIDWLQNRGLESVRDPSLRLLLELEPHLEQLRRDARGLSLEWEGWISHRWLFGTRILSSP